MLAFWQIATAPRSMLARIALQENSVLLTFVAADAVWVFCHKHLHAAVVAHLHLWFALEVSKILPKVQVKFRRRYALQSKYSLLWFTVKSLFIYDCSAKYFIEFMRKKCEKKRSHLRRTRESKIFIRSRLNMLY